MKLRNLSRTGNQAKTIKKKKKHFQRQSLKRLLKIYWVMGIIVKTTRVYRFVKNLEHFLIFLIDSYKFKSSQIP